MERVRRGTLLAVLAAVVLLFGGLAFSRVVGPGSPDPVATGPPAEASPVETTLRDMDQFREELRGMAGRTTTGGDLMGMMRRASALMTDLRGEAAQMSPQDRDRALSCMSDIMGEMARVVQNHSQQVVVPTPGASPAPGGTQGGATAAPGVVEAAPGDAPAKASPALEPEAMALQMGELRRQMKALVNNQPTAGDLAGAMGELQTIMVTMREQGDQLSARDLETLTANMARTTDDMVGVMEVFVRQEGLPRS